MLAVLGWVLVGLLVAAAILALVRFVGLRSRGVQVILRRLPASGNHGWRHGIMRYKGDHIAFYMVRSVSPMADAVFRRSDMRLVGRREPSPREASFMADGLTIVEFAIGQTRREVGLDFAGDMALTTWLESKPDNRTQRPDVKKLVDHITRARRRPGRTR